LSDTGIRFRLTFDQTCETLSDMGKISVRIDDDLLRQLREKAGEKRDLSDSLREAIRAYVGPASSGLDFAQSDRVHRVAQRHGITFAQMLKLCLDFSLDVFESRAPMLPGPPAPADAQSAAPSEAATASPETQSAGTNRPGESIKPANPGEPL
jgi:hypothetical protein